jgi:hypothetical protein
MPILFIHGVAVRSDDDWTRVRKYLREYVAPVIAPDPENVDLRFVKWYPKGGTFYWDRKSRPLSAILGHGGAGEEDTATKAVELATHRKEAFDGAPAGGAGPGPGGGGAGGAGGVGPRPAAPNPDAIPKRGAAAPPDGQDRGARDRARGGGGPGPPRGGGGGGVGGAARPPGPNRA